MKPSTSLRDVGQVGAGLTVRRDSRRRSLLNFFEGKSRPTAHGSMEGARHEKRNSERAETTNKRATAGNGVMNRGVPNGKRMKACCPQRPLLKAVLPLAWCLAVALSLLSSGCATGSRTPAYVTHPPPPSEEVRARSIPGLKVGASSGFG